MASLFTFIVLSLLLVSLAKADDLQSGSSVNNKLAYQERVKLSSIPLKTRTKNVFYSDEAGSIIKGISVIDMDKSNAKASITAGGVGTSFVNIKLKSEKGDGLNYEVQIFI